MRMTPSYDTKVDFKYSGGAQERIVWVDYAKGIGIFLVVVGHVLPGLRNASILNDTVWDEFVVRFIYTFHMPLFFFIAGLFAQHTAKRPTSRFFLDKLSVIAYPYFIWSLLQATLEIWVAKYVNHPIPAVALLKIIYSPLTQFWFLYTLFIILMLYKLAYNLELSSKVFFSFALVCYAVEVFRSNFFYWDVLNSVCYFLIYFALGVVTAQTSLLYGLQKTGWAAGITVMGCVLIAAGVAAHVDHWPLMRLGLAISGIVATIALAILTSRYEKLSFIRTWGLLSLEIFVAHVIAAASIRILLQKAFGLSAPLPHILLGIGLGLYMPILLAYSAQKIGLPYLFTASAKLRPFRL
jgi:fucose 4-O-acetylase-like acetyltransferase